jgi:Ca2+-dependent lipid-binding protein
VAGRSCDTPAEIHGAVPHDQDLARRNPLPAGHENGEVEMAKLVDEIKVDLNFIRSHSLQPKWYKVVKVFILVGFLVGYYLLFGVAKTVLFFASFILLSAVVHLVYRVKTKKWTSSWRDFVVVEEDNQVTAKSIGKFYYSAIVVNAIISLIISQVLA